MNRNYTDEDVSMIQNLDGHVISSFDAKRILEALDNSGRITPPWEPCQREDIRKGDRVRVEFSTGNTVEEYTAVDDHSFDNSSRGARWFRIPAPAPAVEWPTEPGPYLVTWERHGKKYGPEWFICDGETLWNTDKTFLHRESTEGDLKLLSVKKGGVVDE